MQAHPLTPHPATPPLGVHTVEARIGNDDANWLQLRWKIEGSAQLVAARPAGRKRADELWRTTCFELFLQPDGAEAYTEFNFSPSEAWNAYDFDCYRAGMRERQVSRAPVLTMRPGTRFAIFDAAIPRQLLPGVACAVGIAAVIEEIGGQKSYWAMRHPSGDAPDFHHSACFAGRLEAPLSA